MNGLVINDFFVNPGPFFYQNIAEKTVGIAFRQETTSYDFHFTARLKNKKLSRSAMIAVPRQFLFVLFKRI